MTTMTVTVEVLPARGTEVSENEDDLLREAEDPKEGDAVGLTERATKPAGTSTRWQTSPIRTNPGAQSEQADPA